MKSHPLNDLELTIARMMNQEYDAHARLLADIGSRKPANEAQITESLSAVHKARINVFETVLSIIKNLKE